MQPDVLLATIEADALRVKMSSLQLVCLNAELDSKQTEDERLHRAYVAGVFDENEYGERHRLLRDKVARLLAQ